MDNKIPASSVLLVDDDQTSLVALAEVLRLRLPHVGVQTATGARNAFDCLLKTDFDAVVTDILMPVADGMDLLKAIQRHRPNIPVLLISADDAYTTAVKALRAGAYDLILKPIDPEYFCRSLESALLQRQAERMRLEKWERTAHSDLLAKVRVLIVDDSSASSRLLSRTVSSFGAEVTAVRSVVAALSIVEKFQPDVILCDLRLPEEDGYGLVRKLQRRVSGAGRNIPVVAVTGYTNEEPRQRALAAGFRAYLSKDNPPEVLAGLLTGLVKRSTEVAGRSA